MPHPIPAVLALSAALLLPLTVAAPAEAAEGVTVTHTAAPAAKPKPWERLGMSQRRWKHCNTKARPCDKRKPAPRVTNARARVVAAARSFLGTPYRYGGSSHSGTDCSGLVVASYKQALGKRLPRTTYALARAGRAVTRARPGDVLIYSGASHVAIVSAVTSAGRVAMTIVARHTGTVVTLQKPYTSYTVRAFLA